MHLNFKSLPSFFKSAVCPHALIILGFALGSVLYFYPVLEGKVMDQSDIVQYRGMSKQFLDYQTEKGEAVYWTDSAFGGMPTYQLGAKYPYHWVKLLDQGLRFLPRPADYMFLYLLSFYILMLVVLKGDRALSVIGAVGFALMTYHLVILGVGHNAKAHAIAYMPLVVAGLLLLFKNRPLLGFVLLTLASGLEIAANHYQMTYYLAFVLLFIGIYFAVKYFQNQQIKLYFKTVGLGLIAGILALAMNATGLLATSAYAKESTRGANLLTTGPDGQPLSHESGLDLDYITAYSYGIGESLNLLVPGLYGGSNSEKLSTDAASVKYLLSNFDISKQEAIDFAGRLMYWGEQPFVAAPAYLGIILVFLFVLFLVMDKSKLKYWLLGVCLFALMLSWGKNFEFLTNLFVTYFPMYNKFRAVSSIQVILSLLVPIGAMLGMKLVLSDQLEDHVKIKYLKQTSISFLILFGLLYVLKGSGFDFVGTSDGYIKSTYGPDLLRSLRLDREALFQSDLIRSVVMLSLAILSLYFYINKAIRKNVLIVLLFGYVVFDLSTVARRYVSAENFTTKSAMSAPFQASQSDKSILKDSTHFRVLDLSNNPFNSAKASYFHKAFGGYHAAKPKRAQHLFDYHLSQNNSSVLDLLNIKYIIQTDETGKSVTYQNEGALGHAWFVEKLISTASEDEFLASLNDINPSQEASVLSSDLQENSVYNLNGEEAIELISYQMDQLVFESHNAFNGYAVFSEMYYSDGWIATIDGQVVPIERVDYAFRGIEVPKGKHTIIMRFDPQVIYSGKTISLIALVAFLIISTVMFFLQEKKLVK